MEKIRFQWRLIEALTEKEVERYCHNCGKKVLFKDSLKRRRNANGKNIYEYAIYKCSSGHTWNHKLAAYKSAEEADTMAFYQTNVSSKLDLLEIAVYEKTAISVIEIELEQVIGKWRIDKLLAQQVKDLSRSQIEKRIKNGAVLLNGEIVKPSALLKEKQRITLFVNFLQ